MSVQRLKHIKAALKKRPGMTATALRRGLFRAGLFLQRESQKIVPVEFGVLKASANTRLEGDGLSSEAIVSYGAEYAIYVHENLEARHKPGKQAKFLETPLREKQKELAAIILDTTRGGLP